jgi:hypothetical protein
MNVNDLKDSRFLTKHDVEPDVLATIKSYEKVNVAMESQAPETKWTLWFKELPKPLVLNSTNGQLIAAITGSEEAEDWIGKKVVLYNDKAVSFAGKITGGIRVRAPRVQTEPDAPEPTDPEPDPNITTNNPDYCGEGGTGEPPPDDEIPY